jgi:hypothetical protein
MSIFGGVSLILVLKSIITQRRIVRSDGILLLIIVIALVVFAGSAFF